MEYPDRNILNETIIVSKTVRKYLGRPHGNCSYYDGSTGEQPFGSTSHTQCMRRCIGSYWERHHKCYPLFIDNYLHEIDFKKNFSKRFCYLTRSEKLFQEKVDNNIRVICLNYCPKDCLTIEYKTRFIPTDTQIGNKYWHNLNDSEKYIEKSLVWDSTQPLYVYREEPVMSLTDYMSYTGGLFGLWFGTNGKDFIIWIIEKISILWIWCAMKYSQYFSNTRVYVINQ